MVSAAEVRYIRETFGLSDRELSKALGVSSTTWARWEAGNNAPVGLQAEVLRALHGTAVAVADNEQKKQAVRAMIALGVGALLFYLLTR